MSKKKPLKVTKSQSSVCDVPPEVVTTFKKLQDQFKRDMPRARGTTMQITVDW